MRYVLAYRFIFQSPNWAKNLLWGSLCFCVPIVGAMVFVGYLFEVIEWLHRRREEEKLPWVEPTGINAAPAGAIQTEPGGPAGGFEYAAPEQYPDFDVNRLQDYLARGIWPFLVQLVVGLPVGMVLGFLPMVGGLSVSAAVASNAHPLVIVAIVVALVAVYFGGFVLLTLVQLPLYLRAGLRRDFGSAFSMSFLKGFLKRVWLELLLSQLFLHVTGAVLVVVGFLFCIVGAYPASAWMMMATHHIDYQLYELYLQRGGEPIRPREERPGVEIKPVGP